MLPLAFPAYVFAFIYLAINFEYSYLSWLPLQGQFWFLSFVLIMALSPYVFFFTNIGLRSITRSEWETQLLLSGSFSKFFSSNVFPKTFPYLLSAQILVLFECLSDFGAAAMVNVPVITTMIYKLWFDLFSFEGAVLLAIRYSLVIAVILLLEFLIRRNQRETQSLQRDPFVTLKTNFFIQLSLVTAFLCYLTLAFLLPVIQIGHWVFSSSINLQWASATDSFVKSFMMASTVGVFVIILSLLLQAILYTHKKKPQVWNLISTVGYSVPGSILAVSTYAILIYLSPSLGANLLLLGLIFALTYKFLTVGMRPLSDKFQNIPRELFEISQVLKVSFVRQWFNMYWPYLRSGSFVAFFLVVIEVIKEMPLTLMLAPSGYQTLSIKIFNYTSEGEWEKAALPSLMLMVFGLVAVVFLEKSEDQL